MGDFESAGNANKFGFSCLQIILPHDYEVGYIVSLTNPQTTILAVGQFSPLVLV